jgi:hypothetical protein
MRVLTKQDLIDLGITEIPPHIAEGEEGESIGMAFRSGAGNLPNWFEIFQLKTGEFKRNDKHELLGNTIDEVKSM